MASMVKNGEFKTPEAAKHNMVQPALVVEDGAGHVVYKWSWHARHRCDHILFSHAIISGLVSKNES